MGEMNELYFISMLGGFCVAFITGLLLDSNRAQGLPGGAIGLAVSIYLFHNNDLNVFLLIMFSLLGHLSYIGAVYLWENR